MKKILFSILVSGSSACLFAQIPTLDFESWTTMNNGTLAVPEEPTGWVTGNQLVSIISPGNSTSVTKATGADAHGGLAAMKITTVDVVNDPSGGQLPDPTGIAFGGKVQLSPLKLGNGFPYAARPTTCTFWHKYTPQAGDSASCGVVLTKWNGTTRDTIAEGGIVIKTAAASYTQSTFTLTYDPAFSTVIPDSMGLGFSATCLATQTCGKVGSILWVDDIVFSGSNNINEHLSSIGVILFPNPSSGLITISSEASEAMSAVIYDVTGRVVISSSVFKMAAASNTKEWSINTSELSTGVYSYMLVDNSGTAIRAGKFNVIR